MKRYAVSINNSEGYWRSGVDECSQGPWVRFDDAQAELGKLRDELKRQGATAIAGMNAAKAVSSHDLRQAERLRAESSPAALESERAANAALTAENERLRDELTAANLERDALKRQIAVREWHIHSLLP